MGSCGVWTHTLQGVSGHPYASQTPVLCPHTTQAMPSPGGDMGVGGASAHGEPTARR